MIVANADDFGLSSSVNKAIIESFQNKYINRTTIMANMPGFDEAVELAKQNKIMDKVGLHLNFFEGAPLTELIKQEPLFYDNENECMYSYNFLHKCSKIKWFFMPAHTRKALKIEAEAQIKKFLDAGFSSNHFDSHGHSHTFYSVYSSVRKILKKYGFKTSRLSLNLYIKGQEPNTLKKIYKFLYNFIITRSFKSTNYFGAISNFMYSTNKKKNKSYEIMLHPIYKDNKLVNSGYDIQMITIDEYEEKLS